MQKPETVGSALMVLETKIDLFLTFTLVRVWELAYLKLKLKIKIKIKIKKKKIECKTIY